MYRLLLCLGMPALMSCGNEPATNQETSQNGIGNAAGIFQQNCNLCHKENGSGSGPSLQGVLGRWNNDTNRLKAFIRNPSKVVREGNKYAAELFEKYKPVVMTAYPDLSEEQLQALITYVNAQH